MLRTRAVEVSLWEAVLPPEVLRLPEDLARVDALLDDCRIPIDGKVPHPATLMKRTTRCGTAAVDGCNEALRPSRA